MGRTKEEREELRNALYQVLEEGRRALSLHPWAVVAFVLTLTVLPSLHWMQVSPSLAPAVAGVPFCIYLHALGPLALGLILLAAYGLGSLVAAVVGLWFVVLHIPFFFLLYPEGLIPVGGHIFEAAVGLFGIWLILSLRRAQWTVVQRQREISALAAQQVSVLNERIDLLDKVSRQERRLAHLYQMLVLATRAETVMKMAGEFLRLIQGEVEAEYASLTLVNADGALGKRADSFWRVERIEAWAHPGGAAEQILRTGEAQYIADASADPRANPALIQAGIRSYLGLPVKVGGKVTAILFVHSTRADAFQQERELLEAVCGVVGVLLRRAMSRTTLGDDADVQAR